MNAPIYTDSESAIRRSNGTFGPGNIANPAGRPRGSIGGRQQALKILDAILAEVGTQERLAAALKAHLEEDPVRFFKTIVMPLLPTESRHEIAAGGQPWGSLQEMIQRKRELETKSKDAAAMTAEK